MAYDDDGSIIGFKDWTELEAILQELTQAMVVLAEVSERIGAQKLTIGHVAESLQESHLGHLPISMVNGLLDAVARNPKDAHHRITIKELEKIISRATRR
jgi:hypothetical protein